MRSARPARPVPCSCGAEAELLDSVVVSRSADGLVVVTLRKFECGACGVRVQRRTTTTVVEDLGNSDRLSFSR